MKVDAVLRSRGADGRVPRLAQRRVILFFWPTRASSANQISSGLPLAWSVAISSTRAGKVFLKPPPPARFWHNGAGEPRAFGSAAPAPPGSRSAWRLAGGTRPRATGSDPPDASAPPRAPPGSGLPLSSGPSAGDDDRRDGRAGPVACGRSTPQALEH